jgi:hypothetical protein
MKRIKLTQGAVAKVDDEDYEWLKRFRWHLHRSGKRTWYARRFSGDRGIMMHNEILSPLPGVVVDHINHNGLDNRRANLRLCMPADNVRNSRPRKNSSSKYKGVSWDRNSKKWRARISRAGVEYYLGCFTNQIEAAFAYDDRAREFRDAFLYLNFPMLLERDAVRDRLMRTKGKVFSMQFIKRGNGELRAMKARIDSVGGSLKRSLGMARLQKKCKPSPNPSDLRLPHVGLPYEPEQRRLIVVYDVGAGGHRAVPVEGILTLKINGRNYRVI